MTTHRELLTEYAVLAVDNLIDDVPDRAGPLPLSSTDQCNAHADVIDRNRGALAELAASYHDASCHLDPDGTDDRDPFDLIGAEDPCVNHVDDIVYALNLT